MVKGNWYNVMWCKVGKGMSNGSNVFTYAHWRGKFIGCHNGQAVFSTHGKGGWECCVRHIEIVPLPFDNDTKDYWEYCHMCPDEHNGGKKPLCLNSYACEFNPNPFGLMER